MADSKISQLTELTTVDKDNDLLAIVDTSATETKKVLPKNLPISDATQTALDAKEATVSSGTTSQYYRGDKSWQTLDKSAVGLGNVDNTSDANKPISTATQTALSSKADLVDGKVPSSQLPAYVDDVVEVANYAALPATGETGKIYVTLDDNKTYRWSGSAYVEISASLALGETSSTAYRGDRGKTAYDHSQTTGNPHGTTKSDLGLGSVDNTADADKPVSTAQAAAITDAKKEYFVIACSDETTALTTGTAKATFRIPFAGTLTAVRASVTTAQGSGSILTVDINKNGTTVLSTKLTIDNSEKTSTTAATAPVISVSSIADDDEFTIDIDQVGTAPTGLKVTLIVART